MYSATMTNKVNKL